MQFLKGSRDLSVAAMHFLLRLTVGIGDLPIVAAIMLFPDLDQKATGYRALGSPDNRLGDASVKLDKGCVHVTS